MAQKTLNGAAADGNHKTSGKASDTTTELGKPELYINREISTVAFIRRVLEQAYSERHALLDRVRFLSFVSNQTDEFIIVRLAGLHDLVAAQVKDTGPDGMLASQQIEALRPLLLALLLDQQTCLQDEIMPRLTEAGISIYNYEQLNRTQRDELESYFRAEILPVLTPLGVDPSHPFPHISSRSMNLAVRLRDPDGGDLFARVKVPGTLRRFVRVPQSGRSRNGGQHVAFVWLEQVIAAHLDLLFPGVEITGSYPFRVLRDADIEIQSDEAGDLLESMQRGLRERRFGSLINLTVQAGMPKKLRELLREYLQLDAADVWEIDGQLGLGDLSELTDLDRPDLKSPPIVAHVPTELARGQDPFVALKRGEDRHRDWRPGPPIGWPGAPGPGCRSSPSRTARASGPPTAARRVASSASGSLVGVMTMRSHRSDPGTCWP